MGIRTRTIKNLMIRTRLINMAWGKYGKINLCPKAKHLLNSKNNNSISFNTLVFYGEENYMFWFDDLDRDTHISRVEVEEIESSIEEELSCFKYGSSGRNGNCDFNSCSRRNSCSSSPHFEGFRG